MNSEASGIIAYNRASGVSTNATMVEKLGILGMRMGAWLTAGHQRPGFSKIAKLCRTVLPSNKSIQMALSDDMQFHFPYGDAYWGVLFYKPCRYEAELDEIIMLAKNEDYIFVDCGANYGYWSMVVSSAIGGKQEAIAIEASSESFEWLDRNTKANGNRFTSMLRAVSDVSGQHVNLFGGVKHEQRSISADEGVGGVIGTVETIAIDDIDALKNTSKPVLLKLDVEGVEIKAMQGAKNLIAGNSLIVYEEHGRDADHTVTRHLLKTSGLRIFGFGPDGKFAEISNLDEVAALKVSKRRGIGLFATTSPFWINIMMGKAH